MKFWITNAGTQFRLIPRIRLSRERICVHWIGVCFSLKWNFR
ncbi:hypothetical protein PCA31118_04687 [Pandoraea captiosa]|uniref:Uncharacterized protein n=1 Tax=Pandoraea captiosa TaxID=2508302 RepID=A0A5E5AMW2_9BURK|nr:hypothetical protein PCA31118_04687 [Pandoraea captiosa]